MTLYTYVVLKKYIYNSKNIKRDHLTWPKVYVELLFGIATCTGYTCEQS